MVQRHHPTSFNLNVIMFSSNKEFSVDVIYSDYQSNLALAEQLIGTLVKYGNNGQYEPFLAESWNHSDDQKVWVFKLRNNLYDEQGELINSDSFIASFIRNIKYLSSHLGKTPFDNLIDIDKIKLGSSDQNGIVAKSNLEIELRFNKRPNGLIQYLAQPYYGYISKDNFNENGQWADPKKIFSSGHYLIDAWIDSKTIVLKKRKNTFAELRDAPNEVTFSIIHNTSLLSLKNQHTIFYESSKLAKQLQHLKTFITTPEFLISYSLGIGKSSIFKTATERKKFAEMFALYLSKNQTENFDSTFPVKNFYQIDTNIIKQSDIRRNNDVFNYSGKFSIAVKNTVTKENEDLLIKAVEYALPKAKVVIVKYDRNNINAMKAVLSNEDFNLRTSFVNTSSGYENWVVDMMFCSKLGISFPDPHGSVCKLVKDIHENRIPEHEGAERLNKIIEDESYIIPVFREGTRVHFTDDLDIDNQSPTVAVLRFDLIRKK